MIVNDSKITTNKILINININFFIFSFNKALIKGYDCFFFDISSHCIFISFKKLSGYNSLEKLPKCDISN